MERLTPEMLARLVDEAPTEREREILARNPDLQAELEALREQSRALRNLPSVLPPPGDWAELEARLVDEGLIRTGASRSASPRRWLQAAAGLVLFIGGAAVGQTFSADGGSGAPFGGPGADASFASVEEAAEAVELAERRYLEAVNGYQQMVQSEGGRAPTRDPASRFAALEALLAASQAAVRESPADPFFNGVLVNTLMERQQTLRQISGDNWY